MKILSVSINNFMAISTADIALADRGLVLVQGDNKDESSATSNGAGKSSFADAICWCLYGVTARGEDGDKVVNRFGKTPGKNCHVTVVIKDGADVYQIHRYRKHKTHKNALRVVKVDKSPEIDLTKGTDKLTQDVVNQIIGCSYEVFTGAVYAGQERMPDLPGMTDKNLKMLIEEASGATLLEAAYAEAQARLRTRKAEVDAVAALIERAKFTVNTAFEAVTDGEEGKTAFEDARLEAIKLIHAKAIGSKKEYDALKVKIDAGPSQSSLRGKIAALDVAIADVAVERTKESELIKKLSVAESALARINAGISMFEKQVNYATDAVAAVDHLVGCPCSTCDRPYSAEDIGPSRKIAEDGLVANKKVLDDAKASRGAADALVLSAADALGKHRASMTDVSKSNAERAALQTLLASVVAQENALKGLEAAVKSAVEQIKTKKAEINPFILRIVEAQKALTLAESALTGHQLDLELVSKALKVSEAVAKVFSPAGVRAFLLDEVTPFLNDQTAKYLGTLSDGNITATWTTLIKNAKGELREKFSIEVENVNGGDTFKLISGGEKRKVRIACALALQDLVARRATKPIELFIGDEIDDALDPAGIERLTVILEEKARERGSVFIISHTDLKDWVRNTITVTKTGKTATYAESVA